MNKNKNIILTIILIIALALTSLIFFGTGDTDKTDIEIASYVFMLVTEVVSVVITMAISSKKDETFLVAGTSSITGIYFLISLGVNLLGANIFNSLRGILVCNFSIVLIYALIVAVILLFKKEKKDE